MAQTDRDLASIAEARSLARRAKAAESLEYVGLKARQHDQLATNLSYGDQRRVEIARALAADPKLLLLDEPTAGMNPQESERLTGFMRKQRDEFKPNVVAISVGGNDATECMRNPDGSQFEPAQLLRKYRDLQPRYTGGF